MRKSKVIFYCLFAANNVIALFLIGISFLASPSPIQDPSKGIINSINPTIRKFIFIIILSTISSIITCVSLYLNKDLLTIKRNTFIKYFAFQSLFLVGVKQRKLKDSHDEQILNDFDLMQL